MTKRMAERARAKRLSLNLSQKSLATRSGVSLGVLKKFERTGKISLESLLKLALIIGALEEFKDLFKPKPPEEYLSLEALLREKKPKRGRL
jgi:transcriptional regulator with XRE-family HTH domain